ncbi:MAG: hypothetical protein ABR585_12560 [Gemmatimonadaceae bacterium]
MSEYDSASEHIETEQTMNKEQEWERKQKAYDMRLRGKTYRAISDELSIGVGTAHRWVDEVLQATVLPSIEAVRKQEIDRLMRYLDKLDARIEEEDDKAIALALKVSERLSKMLGIDAPQQLHVEKTEVTQVDLAIRDILSSVEARNAMRKQEARELRAGTTDIDDLSEDAVTRIVEDM